MMHESKRILHDLADLWSRVCRLAKESLVGLASRYGPLVVHQDMTAMTIRRGSDSITRQEWLDPYRIPPPRRSAIVHSSSRLPGVKG